MACLSVVPYCKRWKGDADVDESLRLHKFPFLSLACPRLPADAQQYPDEGIRTISGSCHCEVLVPVPALAVWMEPQGQ